MNRYQVIVEFKQCDPERFQPAWRSPMYEGDTARDVYAAYSNAKRRPGSKITKVVLCKDGVVVARA